MLRLALSTLLALVFAVPAGASPFVQYGIQDDAWLLYGEGTVHERVAELDALGVDLVRFTIDWSMIEKRRGVREWERPDTVLHALRDANVAAVVSLWGTPRWANGGRDAKDTAGDLHQAGEAQGALSAGTPPEASMPDGR